MYKQPFAIITLPATKKPARANVARLRAGLEMDRIAPPPKLSGSLRRAEGSGLLRPSLNSCEKSFFALPTFCEVRPRVKARFQSEKFPAFW
jgi:hypothetical protein